MLSQCICYTLETYQILSPVLFQQSLYFPLLIHRIFYLLVVLTNVYTCTHTWSMYMVNVHVYVCLYYMSVYVCLYISDQLHIHVHVHVHAWIYNVRTCWFATWSHCMASVESEGTGRVLALRSNFPYSSNSTAQ